MSFKAKRFFKKLVSWIGLFFFAFLVLYFQDQPLRPVKEFGEKPRRGGQIFQKMGPPAGARAILRKNSPCFHTRGVLQ